MFRRVALSRSQRGIEVLPDMIGCPNISSASSEVEADGPSAILLRKSNYRARDYVEVGWAILLASNPRGFGSHADETIAANGRFLAGRGAEVRALLYPN